MTSANQTATMVSGDDTVVELTVTNADDTAADLSGSSLTFALADSDNSVVVEKTTSDGEITITGTDDDVAEVQLDAADTADLAGRYQMELEEETSGGDTATLMQGVLTITEDIIT